MKDGRFMNEMLTVFIDFNGGKSAFVLIPFSFSNQFCCLASAARLVYMRAIQPGPVPRGVKGDIRTGLLRILR